MICELKAINLRLKITGDKGTPRDKNKIAVNQKCDEVLSLYPKPLEYNIAKIFFISCYLCENFYK